MRTSTVPAVRVSPALRSAAEGALRDGETLSSFVEAAIQLSVRERSAQRAFLEGGLVSAAGARESGEYVTEDALLAELDAILFATGTDAKG